MKKLLFILLLIIYGPSSLDAQTKVADKFFKDYAYSQAIELYKEALQKGDSSLHVLTRLGDCYYNNSKAEASSIWYKMALDRYSDIDPEYIFKYIQTQLSLNQYETAKNWIAIYKSRKAKDKRFISTFSIENFEALKATDRVYVNYENLDINTSYSDFGGVENDGILYFSSTRVKDSIIDEKKLYLWNQEPYLNLYQAEIQLSNKAKKIHNIRTIASDHINTDFHEASVALTQDGKTIFFTRDNLNKRNKVTYDKEGTANLKIYKATRNTSDWENLEELPFNGKAFSTGSPSISPDGQTLFFASDRPGGFGQTDLYKVAIYADGSYGEPINLGSDINTEGRENFPFVAKDSTLYFSSDSHLTLGFYDIFESNILKVNKSKIEIKNLGAPFNSGYDDFAFFIDSETRRGYFSSDRPDGKGGDDIYAFGKYDCKQSVTGLTKNKKSLAILGEVVVRLIDENGKEIERITTGEDGAYSFENLACDTRYTIVAEKVIYRTDKKEFKTSITNGDSSQIDLLLEPLIINNEIVINPIYFDYNKSNIRPDAAYELENIVAVMREHSEMTIKIEAHTDSRGRDIYNMKLSDRRAKSTRDYLYSRGITSNRIESAIGYGESQLVNACKNKVKCSEAKHQENRRSKFIITEGYTP